MCACSASVVDMLNLQAVNCHCRFPNCMLYYAVGLYYYRPTIESVTVILTSTVKLVVAGYFGTIYM